LRLHARTGWRGLITEGLHFPKKTRQSGSVKKPVFGAALFGAAPGELLFKKVAQRLSFGV
jgi:hypothetical protein